MEKPKIIHEQRSKRSLIARELAAEDRDASIARAAVQKSIQAKSDLARECLDDIVDVARVVTTALQKGGRVAFFGNGGSAADAQHIVAELVGRFKSTRRPLKALAFTTNSSIITAIGNDFGFDEIFARQVQANLAEGDVAVAISTSGRSRNVISGVREARRVGARTVALTGSGGGQLAALCDHTVVVPSADTQRIQECHIMIGHIICELIDEAFGHELPDTAKEAASDFE